MREVRFTLVLFLMVFLAAVDGCDEESFYDSKRVLECHEARNWDVQQIRDEVVGVWEWQYVWCCGEADPYLDNTASKELRIEFKANGTALLANPAAVMEFIWSVQPQNDYYIFDTNQDISQLSGRILFCDDTMLCEDSHRDGANNYFVRAE